MELRQLFPLLIGHSRSEERQWEAKKRAKVCRKMGVGFCDELAKIFPTDSASNK